MIQPAQLEAFFNPQRIAIVGASEEGLYPAGVIRNLAGYGFPGKIYPVNPNRDAVFGIPCYPSLAVLPGRPDLAVIVVNRQRALPALQQAVEAGIRAAVVFTAGFAEADEEGRRLQAQMLELAQQTGLAIVGPNCAGLADIPGRVVVTRLPQMIAPGGVSLASQSGALMMALYGLFYDWRIGLNRLISVGNGLNVDIATAIAHLAEDQYTRVIAAFVEGLSDGRGFAAALRRALVMGRPVVLVKSGQTMSGQAAAASHTAAAAGSDRVFAAVCRQFGAILVDDLRPLLDTVGLLAAYPGRLSRRLTIVTQSGGMGSLAADACDRNGIRLPPLSQSLLDRLAAAPHLAALSAANPFDVRGPALRGGLTPATLEPFLQSEGSDPVMLLLARTAVQDADAETATGIIAAAQQSAHPLLVVWAGQRYPAGENATPLAHRLLVEAGVPLFEQVGDALFALAQAVRYGEFREQRLSDPEWDSSEWGVPGKEIQDDSPAFLS